MQETIFKFYKSGRNRLDNANTIRFENKEQQLEYFKNLPQVDRLSAELFNYQRANLEPLEVFLEGLVDDLESFDYLAFRNKNDGKIYYAFVTQFDYVNQKLTKVTFTIDVIQTYMFDYQVNDAFIEREHSSLNLTPEDFQFGDGDFEVVQEDVIGVEGISWLYVFFKSETSFQNRTQYINGNTLSEPFATLVAPFSKEFPIQMSLDGEVNHIRPIDRLHELVNAFGESTEDQTARVIGSSVSRIPPCTFQATQMLDHIRIDIDSPTIQLIALGNINVFRVETILGTAFSDIDVPAPPAIEEGDLIRWVRPDSNFQTRRIVWSLSRNWNGRMEVVWTSTQEGTGSPPVLQTSIIMNPLANDSARVASFGVVVRYIIRVILRNVQGQIIEEWTPNQVARFQTNESFNPDQIDKLFTSQFEYISVGNAQGDYRYFREDLPAERYIRALPSIGGSRDFIQLQDEFGQIDYRLGYRHGYMNTSVNTITTSATALGNFLATNNWDINSGINANRSTRNIQAGLMMGAGVASLFLPLPGARVLGVGMIARTASQTIGEGIQHKQNIVNLKNTPDTFNNIGGHILQDVAFDQINLFKRVWRIKKDNWLFVANYMHRYGYKVNRFGTPKLKSRQRFDFIKCQTISLKSDLPRNVEEAICNIYIEGVTFWHDVENMLDYTLANREVIE